MTDREEYPEFTELELVPPGSEILNRVANPVLLNEIGSMRIQEIINGMLQIAHGEQGNPARPTMVGLAAPQVGVSERIVLIGVDAQGMGEEPTFHVFLNPEVTERSGELVRGREGCYSTGTICGIVPRHEQVTVRALNEAGETIEETLTGIGARIAQHEIDHLDGIRFPDRITDDNDLLVVGPDQFGAFRTDWENWPYKAPRADWDALKAGQ
jgi:peptide deformylase